MCSLTLLEVLIWFALYCKAVNRSNLFKYNANSIIIFIVLYNELIDGSIGKSNYYCYKHD